ncbi:MAG: hypothetical protein L3J14_08150 [Flavobacteriaceae bacterium]|nr:hypothetical protein [Flavobacteriaceae bacterium]
MDELDKLKNVWKSQDYSKHKVSTTDIYKMLHAKSSSYVKWIFYISIAEFLIVLLLTIFVDKRKYIAVYEKMVMTTIIQIITIISYTIIIVFIILFYQNFKKIHVDCNAKTLMNRILKTRKTVKLYIYYNIGFMLISMFILFYSIFSSQKNNSIYREMSNIPDNLSNKILIISIIIFTIVLVVVILLFYRLIYGILLKRLKKNYKELEQLDK